MTTFFHWPGRQRLGDTVRLGLAVTVWWILVYGGADLIAGQRTWRLRAHLPFEPNYPFIPATVLAYNSLYPLCWLAPFVLRSWAQLEDLARAMARVTAIAGVCFVLVPVANAFGPTPDAGVWTGLVGAAKAAALSHNFLPSLHVALASVAVAFYSREAGALPRLILYLWLAAIGVSTLLLHQHYLADVATGMALGFLNGPRMDRRPASCSPAG